MTRVRLVTTPIWSHDHLVRALAQVGYTQVETHGAAVPLESWRGTPLEADAHVVVRRVHVGASGDDFGFVRNARGSFDAVISEIHFFRFDRRWLEDLARRHDELTAADGRTAPAGIPTTWEKRELGSMPPVRAESMASAPPPLARTSRTEAATRELEVTRARAETASALDDLRKKQKKSDGPGCIASFIGPVIAWVLVGALVPDVNAGAMFALFVVPLWIVMLIVHIVRMGRRARAAAVALHARLPTSAQARAAAESYLEAKLRPAGAKNDDALVKEFLKALREAKV